MSIQMATVGREGLNRFSFDRPKVAIFVGGSMGKYKMDEPWRKTLYGIRSRCRDPKHPYCRRGIKNFLSMIDIEYLWKRDRAWELKEPSIDRKDPSKNYTLDNCQYIEMAENRRKDTIGKPRRPEVTSKMSEGMLKAHNSKQTKAERTKFIITHKNKGLTSDEVGKLCDVSGSAIRSFTRKHIDKAISNVWSDRWSRLYKKCKECGTIEIAHGGMGLCDKCYKQKQWQERKRKDRRPAFGI